MKYLVQNEAGQFSAQDSNKPQGEQFFWVRGKEQAIRFGHPDMALAHARNNIKDGVVVDEEGVPFDFEKA